MKNLIQSNCNGLQIRFKGPLWGLIQSYDPRKSSSLKQWKAPRKIYRKSCGVCIFVFKKIHLYPYLTVCPSASSSAHVQHQLPVSLHLALLSLPTQNLSPLQANQHFPTHPPPTTGLCFIQVPWHSLDPTAEQSEVTSYSSALEKVMRSERAMCWHLLHSTHQVWYITYDIRSVYAFMPCIKLGWRKVLCIKFIES